MERSQPPEQYMPKWTIQWTKNRVRSATAFKTGLLET